MNAASNCPLKPSALVQVSAQETVVRMVRYIGLDLHKDYVHGFEWTPGKEKGRHFRFPNSRQAWERFVQQVDRDCHVAFEVTGNALQVYDWLIPRAGQVVPANPVELKRLGSGRHTDRVDAERLAKMLALGTVPAVWVPPHPVREMRALLKYREQLVRQRTRLQNQARAVLRRNGYSLPKSGDVREWLERQKSAVELPGGDRKVLDSALRMLEVIDREMAALEAEIAARAAQRREVRLLFSITGLGVLAAAMIWARIGDPTRFRSAKAVGRYAGLDPSVYQSGEKDRRGRISKNGARDLRTILVQAAYQVGRHDTGPLGQFYRRKEKQLGRKRAVVALARKLLIVAWKVLQTGELYRAVKQELYERKLRQLEQKSPQEPRKTKPEVPLAARDGDCTDGQGAIPAPVNAGSSGVRLERAQA